MITTLRTGALTLTSVQYQFDANKLLTIKLTTTGNHTLYGNVNIALANVLAINVYDINGALITDFFNETFSFKRTGAATLEYTQTIQSGIAQSIPLSTLTNNGAGITATVANASFDLVAGTYNFLLLSTADSVFSTSKVSIKQLDVGGTGVDGVESLFYQVDDLAANPQEFSINNVDLTFNFSTRVSINADVSGTTNIPLIIT
tara:strand:- start:22783 stop:23391 length:609 start_codon:yes stop_codon:yes gene_type:complete